MTPRELEALGRELELRSLEGLALLVIGSVAAIAVLIVAASLIASAGLG